MDNAIRTMKLKVEDIECCGCAEDYEKVLAERDGFLTVSFDFNECIITIQYDPSINDKKQVYVAVRKLVKKATILSDS